MPRSPIRLAFSCLIHAGSCLLSVQSASSGPIDVPALVAACSPHRNTIKLDADNDVACFDGQIMDATAPDRLKPLNSGGKFVIRSPGGNIKIAMEIADLRRRRRWSSSRLAAFACANAILSPPMRPMRPTIRSSPGTVARVCSLKRAGPTTRRRIAGQNDFVSSFCKRGIKDDFVQRLQTLYSCQMYRAILSQGYYDKRSIFWMWHPENFGTYFKSKITFDPCRTARRRSTAGCGD